MITYLNNRLITLSGWLSILGCNIVVILTEVIMDSTDKLTDVNQVLQYLAEKFPACFSTRGEAKPLKVGLFNDLAERLADDPRVSKTQLRVAMRRYTNSWRYLKSIKLGIQRVDLDGEACGALTEEHVTFAQQRLQESQERFKARKKQQNEEKKNADSTDSAPKPSVKHEKKAPKRTTAKHTPKKKVAVGKPASMDQLKIEQRVKVKLGTKPVLGHILDLGKEEIHVQLDSGLTIKVRPEHILL